MVISPNDFSLWSRLTGNKYPSTPKERAQKGPEVQRFIQNLGREGMLGGKEDKKEKEDSNLGKKIATGALIAGGLAAAVAAGRDERVQNTIKNAVAATKTKADDFLSNFAQAKVVDADIVDAYGDVTPDPSVQQSNTAPTQKAEVTVEVTPEKDSFTPLVEGKTSFTEGSISKEDPYGDIGNVEQRVDRTYEKLLGNLKPEDAATTRSSLIRDAKRARDYELGYMNAKARGRTDEQAAITGRKFAGYDLEPAVKPQTPYRKAISGLKIASQVPAQVDELINLVKTGPKIVLPESVQEPGALVQLGTGNTTNVIPTSAGEVGGSTLTDQHLTKMEVDNVLDDARNILQGEQKLLPGKPEVGDVSGPVKITGITTTGQRRTGGGIETAPTTPVGKLKERNPSLAVTKLARVEPKEDIFAPASDIATREETKGQMLQQGQNVREFIEDEFSEGPVASGTVMPEKFSTGEPLKDDMESRINNLRLENLENLMSGNLSPQQESVLGKRLKSGLIYKNSPRLARMHAEQLTAAMIGDRAADFGPEFTKLKQNLELGADFDEIMKDPSKKTVRIGGEDIDRSEIERPAAFSKTAKTLDERIQQQKDFRGEVKLEAMSNMRAIARRGQALKDLQNSLKADGNTSGVERVEIELNKLRGSYQKEKARIPGITRKTEANIRNLSVPRTLQSLIGKESGTGYKVDVQQRDDLTTGGFNRLDPQLEVKVIPDVERKIETKREIDTGGFDMPEEVETGRKGGFSLEQPGTKLIKDREGDFTEVTVGDMTAGSKPTGIAGEIQDIYRTGDPTTIKQRVDDFLNQKDPTGELRQTAAEQQELAIKKDATRPLNVIVAGGRNYSDYKTVKAKLDDFRSTLKPGREINIISGGATGADSLGERYAKENNLDIRRFSADWNQHGKAAGPIRNEQMAAEGDVLISFPGGTGTKNMIKNMRSRGKRVIGGIPVPKPDASESTGASGISSEEGVGRALDVNAIIARRIAERRKQQGG
tara:strand:+ start:74 stop:3061 length:2988 start_codon:yes stop_codon:yes gene_type:complete